VTFSICVHEAHEAGGERHDRFGVAATARVASVGALCPFASERGAVATQSYVNVDLGRRGIDYVDDGLAVEDALRALLNADDGAEGRQLHGVDADGTFAFTGDDCEPWAGHVAGDGYTVAGNLLAGESVVEATAAAYEADREGEAPLAERLLEALAAGHAEGGDRRADLAVGSVAVRVETTAERAVDPYYDDLRVDASETPVADAREAFALAERSYAETLERYGLTEGAAGGGDADA
jgi:uncharacterized Ntn-hydrolase superfamily protein